MIKSLKSGLMASLFASALALGTVSAAWAAVDVNKATEAELDSIKGIGPGTSKRILEERAKGTFKDWQDFVDRVKGVGEGNAAKFSKEGLTVNGSPAPASLKANSGKPADKAAKPAEAGKPAKPADDAKPADGTKPADATKPAKPEKPADGAKPADAAKPAKGANDGAKAGGQGGGQGGGNGGPKK